LPAKNIEAKSFCEIVKENFSRKKRD